MLTRALLICTLIMVGAFRAHAEDEFDIKVYPTARASGAITVDGALDEPAWAKALLVGGFTLYSTPNPAPVPTFFRLLYDDAYLYFGVVCDEPLMKKLTPIAQARDNFEVFHGETIEIFVDPKHNHADYYQFAINAAGSVYDSYKMDPSWSADVKAATKMEADKWTLEFAIPWKDLGVQPKQGALVGFNICRDRYLGEDREWTNWTQTIGGFHDPERFAVLMLSPTPEQLGKAGEQLRMGGRRGKIVIYNQQSFSQATYRSLARQSIGKLEKQLAELEKTKDREGDPKTKAELETRIKAYEAEVAPFRAGIQGKQNLDVAEWTRMDLRINQLEKELDGVIWDARLSALLSDF